MKENLERGIRYYHAHRYEQALTELQMAAEEREATPEVSYYLGLTLTQLGRHEDALLHLERVVSEGFSFLHVIQSRMVLGYVYSITGRWRLAEFEFMKVSDSGIQSSQALAALGYVQYAQRKVAESVASLRKALEIDANNANALNSLGFIYAQEGIDLGRALSLCRQAVDINPRNPAYLDSLGWANFLAGDPKEARIRIRKALELAPGNKEVAGHLRKVMEKLKNT
jgi:Flp pilus assembly protein TadD